MGKNYFFLVKHKKGLCAFFMLFLAFFSSNAQNATNYNFANSSTASLTTMTGSTQLVAASQDDTNSGVFNIGFPFWYLGNWYGQFSASSNGAVRLGGNINATLYGSSAINAQAIIAPYFGDFETSATGKVHYVVTGSAPNRVLVVEWLNMGINWGSSTADATWQLRLYEGSQKMEMVYGAMAVGTGGTSAGGGGTTVRVGFSNANSANNIFSVNQSTYAIDNTSATSITSTNGSVGTITTLNSASNGSRRMFTFTPNYTFQVYASGSGSWTAPTSPTCISTFYVDTWGGGGGAGSSNNTTTNGGSGGGSGGYSRGTHTISSGGTFYYSVGTAGAGGPASSTTAPTAGTLSWFNATGTNAAPISNFAGTLANGGGAGVNNSTATPTNGAVAGYGNVTANVGAAGVAGTANKGGNGGAAPNGGDGGTGSNSTSGTNGGTPGGGGGGGDDTVISAGGNGGTGYVAFWYEIGAAQTFTSSTVTQDNVLSLQKSTTNNQIIAIPVTVNGSGCPMLATSFSLNTTGTTSTSDISNAKLWFTGSSSTFATTSQFGSTYTSPSGSYTITGSQILSAGTNYFWLTYDVVSGATDGDIVDAECTSVTVGGTSYMPSVTAPSGSRTILTLKNWIGAGVSGGTGNSNFNTASNWSPAGVPSSTNEAIITTTTAATITLSANATIGRLTVLNNGNVTLAFDTQTNVLEVVGNSIFNCATAGTSSSTLSLRVGNSPGKFIFDGDADFGPNAAASPYIGFEGSAAGATTGSVVFKGNTSFSVTFGSLTGTIGTFIWDKNGTQTISTNPSFAVGFPGAVQIGDINTPNVEISTVTTTGCFVELDRNMTIKAGATLDLKTKYFYPSAASTGTLSIESGGKLICGNDSNNGVVGVINNFPPNFATYSLNANSTVEYNATATQDINAIPIYGHLIISNNSVKTPTAALTLVGDLLINSPATFASSTFAHTVGGNWTNNGTFTYNNTGTTATVTFNGANNATVSGSSVTDFYKVVVNKGTNISTVLDVTGSGNVSIAAGATLTMTNGLLRVSTSGNFANNSGTNTTIASTSGIEINGGTFSNTASIVSNGIFRLINGTASVGTASGNSLTNQSGSTCDIQGGILSVSGRLQNTSGAYNQSGGIVTLCTVGNASASIANFDMSLGTNMNVSGGTVIIRNSNSVGNSINIVNSTGTKTITGGVFQIGDASTPVSQTFLVNSVIPFYNFTINSTNNPVVRLVTNDLIIGGTLTMSGGNIDGATNSKDVIVTNSAAGAVVQTAGYINHNLKRAIATTGVAYLYPVGLSASSNYTPASLLFTNLTSGDLTVKANSNDEPNIATSSIDSAKSVNAYWVVTPSGSMASTNYAGTLGYASGLNDDTLVASSYVVGKYNASWNYPSTTAAPTATSLSFTGANGFGNLAIGKCKTISTSVAGSNQTICETTTSVTLAANNPTVGTGTWSVTSGPSSNASQFANVNTYNTTFTPDGGVGTYVLTWTIDLPSPCSSPSSSNVSIIINGSPTVATNGSTQNLCLGSSATLSGNSVLVGTGAWSVVGGPSSNVSQFSSVSNPTATFTPDGGPGSYVIRWTISNSPCTNTTADATITVKTPVAITSATAASSPICSGLTTTLTANGVVGDGAVVTWYTGSGATGTNLGTGLTLTANPGTYYAYVTGDCGTAQASVTVLASNSTWIGGTGNWDVSTNWSCNEIPTITTPVIISSGIVTVPADAEAASITMSSTATLTVSSGYDLTIDGTLDVASTASVTIENNANLLQNGTTNSNVGTTVNVKRASSPLFRLDYTLWSSPTSGTQTLAGFSNLTSANRFYTYNEGTDAYVANNGSGTFTTSKGYLIRMPNNWVAYPGTAASWTGTFIGKPNSGNISYAMDYSTNGYNAIGNPYPSTLSVDEFLDYNITNYNNIEGTIWLWRKTNDATNPVSYSTCTAAGSTLNNSHAYSDDDFLSTGQGFIVKAKSATDLYFNNAMRSSTNTNQFFRSVNANRYWLELKNANNVSYGQKLIAYLPNTTTGYDNGYDGLFIGDSQTALLSLVEGRELVIQARTAFNTDDIVPLLFKTNVAGTYSVSLSQLEGIFNNGQDILLRDNQTGTVHNLSASGAYSFSTEVGSFTSRFEVLYQNALSTASFNENSVVVYNNNHNIHVNSGRVAMDKVKVFDVRGRLIIEKSKVNSSELVIDGSRIANQVLLLQITSTEGSVITKKIVN